MFTDRTICTDDSWEPRSLIGCNLTAVLRKIAPQLDPVASVEMLCILFVLPFSLFVP